MLALLENRDSFSHNLVQAFAHLGAAVAVLPARSAALAELERLAPTHLVIGPGPGRPSGAGISLEAARHFAGRIPLLGVCLGLQVVAEAFGARIIEAPAPVHGHADRVHHDGRGLFRGLPDPLTVGRYHSLSVDPEHMPSSLEISARANDGTVQGLRHRELAVEAVQFHPESILSPDGLGLLANFLALGGTAGR